MRILVKPLWWLYCVYALVLFITGMLCILPLVAVFSLVMVDRSNPQERSKTQTPIQPILFLDTYDRMHYSSIFHLRPGATRAVFLKAIPVEGPGFDDLPALRGQVYRLMEEKLIEYRASWIGR